MDNINKVNSKLCFIISHKYYRNYTSYIQYYVENIEKFYPDSLTIIVDNNSKNIRDIIVKIKSYKNVIILSNMSSCKFELGAYTVGLSFLIKKNILNNFDYIIFSQDTFVLKNKYDFNELRNKNINAISFGTGKEGNHHYGHFDSEHSQQILKKIILLDSVNNLSICWCNSFILHNSKIMEFLDITKDIVITIRTESEYSERYFGAIIYYFNNNKYYSMCNIDNGLSYDCCTVNLIEDSVIECFVKRIQQKTENTKEIE